MLYANILVTMLGKLLTEKGYLYLCTIENCLNIFLVILSAQIKYTFLVIFSIQNSNILFSLYFYANLPLFLTDGLVMA